MGLKQGHSSYGLRNITIYFLWRIFLCSACTDKLLYISTDKIFVQACHLIGFSCSNYKVKVNVNIVTIMEKQ